jgi:hypothetical protein
MITTKGVLGRRANLFLHKGRKCDRQRPISHAQESKNDHPIMLETCLAVSSFLHVAATASRPSCC